MTTHCFTKAIEKTIRKNNIPFDAIYSHFITPAGIAAARLGAIFHVPVFMAHGEATTMTIDHFGKEKVAMELEQLSGIIAVSTDNKKMLQNYLGLSRVNIQVFPNAVRRSRFHPKDKNLSRGMFNLPKDVFIVSFVGSFDKRKGIKRLEEAVDRMDDVYFIAAGSGELSPKSEKCLFYGQVPNEKLPFFYSSSDVFALPTLNEGSCNAIIEAIACGLPIVSSNRSYNDDILCSDISIRVNPESIDELVKAIQDLKNDYGTIDKFSKASQRYAERFDIKFRASNIINFMDIE
jgi:glycosyltransferase involved in cell wall biosynthesis